MVHLNSCGSFFSLIQGSQDGNKMLKILWDQGYWDPKRIICHFLIFLQVKCVEQIQTFGRDSNRNTVQRACPLYPNHLDFKTALSQARQHVYRHVSVSKFRRLGGETGLSEEVLHSSKKTLHPHDGVVIFKSPAK